MNQLLQDIRYGLRTLSKTPGFAIVAILTLALGIGANTAIFSIINAVLLRPLPFPDPDRLTYVTEMFQRPGGVPTEGSVSYPDFFDWRSSSRSFEDMASYYDSEMTLTGSGEPLHLSTEVVSSGFFSVLGVNPVLGRGFRPEEEKPGMHVAVLSHELWQSVFGGDKGIVGKVINLNNRSYTVIGVMPAGFAFPIEAEGPKLWTTLASDAEVTPPGKPATEQRGAHFIAVIARRKTGVSLQQAQQEMNLIAQNLSVKYPDTNRHTANVKVIPELEELVGDTRPALLVLLIAVAMVLLIACVNVANLLLIRASNRVREMALRSALGATRLRVVRQMLTESLLLSLAGAVLGIPLALWALGLFGRLQIQGIPRMQSAALDGNVLAFTAAVAGVTSVLFGLIPAWQAASPRLMHFLREGSRGTGGTSSGHSRVRSVLVVAETALGLALLVAAGLLLRSFRHMIDVDPGFDTKNILTFNFQLPDSRYSELQQIQFYDQLIPRLKALPGVTSAAGTTPLPFSGNNFRISFEIKGRPMPAAGRPTADIRAATPGYFRTMGIPVLRGRDFDETDGPKSDGVAIINEAFAKLYFPNEDPIGKVIVPGLGTSSVPREPRRVIGVVRNIKHGGLTAEFRPQSYLPFSQAPVGPLTICMKTSRDPLSLTNAVRRQLASMDRELPVYGIKTMDDYVAVTLSQPRFHALLLECFALLGLVLTAVGVYGVVAYSVAQRTQEIGIRMALGATQAGVMRLVLNSGIRLIGLGIGIGVIGAWVAGRLSSSFTNLLFGVKTFDPVTYAAVAGLLALVTFLASYMPARRAAKVDPMIALRSE